MASWGSVTGTVSGSNSASFSMGFEWSITSQSTANNTSTVLIRMWGLRKNTGAQSVYGYDQTSWFEHDGGNRQNITTQYDWRNATVNVTYYVGTHTAVFMKGASRTITVTHDSAGKRTLPIQTFFKGSGTYFTSASTSGNAVLDQIWRTHAAPANITFDAPTYGSNKIVSWGSVATAVDYRLEYSKDNGSSWFLETTTSSTSYEVNASRWNDMGTVRYRVRVNSKDGWNVSSWTAGANRTVLKATQAAPISPSVSNITDNSITVTHGSGFVRLGVAGQGYSSPKVFEGLSPNQTYDFYAYLPETSTHLASPNSGVASGTTTKSQQTAPEAPIVEGITSTSITLSRSGTYIRQGVAGAGHQSPSIFANLEPDTMYSFYAYYPETSTHFISPNSLVTNVTTLSEGPEHAKGIVRNLTVVERMFHGANPVRKVVVLEKGSIIEEEQTCDDWNDSYSSENVDCEVDELILAEENLNEYYVQGTRISKPLLLGDIDGSIIEWDSAEPTDTAITISTGLSANDTTLPATFTEVTDGGEILKGVATPIEQADKGKYLFIKQTLETDDIEITPRLDKLTVNIIQPENGSTLLEKAIEDWETSYSSSNVIATVEGLKLAEENPGEYYISGERISNPILIVHDVALSAIRWQESLAGKEIENLVINGNFIDGTTGWSSTNSNIDVIDEVLEMTATDENGRCHLSSQLDIVNDVVYRSARIKSNSNLVGIAQTTTRLASHSGNGEWERISAINTATDGHFSIVDGRSEGWDEVEFHAVMLLNLTELGLEHKTVEEIDAMFPHYFDGIEFSDAFTKIKIYTGISENNITLPTIFTEAVNGDPIADIERNKYLWVKQVLSTEDINLSPTLSLLSAGTHQEHCFWVGVPGVKGRYYDITPSFNGDKTEDIRMNLQQYSLLIDCDKDTEPFNRVLKVYSPLHIYIIYAGPEEQPVPYEATLNVKVKEGETILLEETVIVEGPFEEQQILLEESFNLWTLAGVNMTIEINYSENI
jgi:hypothetical protein